MIRRALGAAVLLLAVGACSSEPEEVAGVCRGDDLRLDHSTSGDGRHFQFHLQNISSSTCLLADYPTDLTGVNLAGARQGIPFTPRPVDLDPQPGKVKPGATGSWIYEAVPCLSETVQTMPLYRDLQLEVPGGGFVPLEGILVPVGCETRVSRLGLETNFETQKRATATTLPPETTTTFSSAARPCRGSDLRVRLFDSGSIMSQPYDIYALRNVSSTVCALAGSPTIMSGTSEEMGRTTIAFSHGTYVPGPSPGDVAPGADGYVVVETGAACDAYTNTSGPIYRDVRLGLPGGGSVKLTEPVDGRCGIGVSDFGGRKAEQ